MCYFERRPDGFYRDEVEKSYPRNFKLLLGG